MSQNNEKGPLFRAAGVEEIDDESGNTLEESGNSGAGDLERSAGGDACPRCISE